jgi:hypothetical protein
METLTIPAIWKIIYWVFALCLSLFYSLKAFKIHLTHEGLVNQQRKNKNYAWFFHQWWFNFIASLIGWGLIWMLLPSLILIICQQKSGTLSFVDILLLIIGLLGITGHLPLTIFGIAKNTDALISKVTTPK